MIIGISGKINSGKDTVGAIIQYLVWKDKVEKGISPLQNYSLQDFMRATFYAQKYSDWQIRKFADKLKDMVCLMIGCTREQLEDRVFKETPLPEIWWYYKSGGIVTLYPDGRYKEFGDRYLVKTTPRLLLQQMGTECGRDIIHPNLWCNALISEYKHKIIGEYNDQGGKILELPNWIITDMRFPNELEAVKSRGGITIRVNRIIGKRVYIISNEQPFENWYGIVESYNGNNFYNIINNVDDVILVHKNQITLQDEHESETALDNAEFDYTFENNGTIEDLVHTVSLILKREKII